MRVLISYLLPEPRDFLTRRALGTISRAEEPSAMRIERLWRRECFCVQNVLCLNCQISAHTNFNNKNKSKCLSVVLDKHVEFRLDLAV